ncbi:MAG: NADH-quinone oxidoreductase subunit A [Candidatus Hydrothermarchaeales archaeon]
MSLYEYYIPVAIFAIVGLSVPIVLMLLSKLLAPSNKYSGKLTTYECGVEPTGVAQIQYHMQYYMFAIIFVVFDVEMVFMYPWAVVFPNLGMLAVIEMIMFILILVIGLIYAWKKGVLEWIYPM